MAPETRISLTLNEVYNTYLETMKPEARVADGMYVRQFCEFVGFEARMDLLTGSRVDSYVEQRISESDPNAPERVQALKKWFQWLKKHGHTPTNYGARVRLRRQPRGYRGTRVIRDDQQRLEMTADGIAKLEGELQALEEQRPVLMEAVARAREDKDFRENAPLDAAREALAHADGRIRELRDSLKRAVALRGASDGRAGVGSKVRVTRVEEGTEHEYMLVNPQEANARESRISVASPVGSQLLGKGPGDEVVIEVPSGTLHLRIDEVVS